MASTEAARALGSPEADPSKFASRDPYRWLYQQCPICEIAPTKQLGARGGDAHRQRLGVQCQIWQCAKCKLIFPNPMPIPMNGVSQHYEVSASEYFENHNVESKRDSAVFLLAQAFELLGRRGSLLDIGCGRGELLLVARDKGWDVLGIEPSHSFAALAAEYSGAEIRSEPLEKCGFSSESFDVVVLSGVLEHLYMPNETIAEVARILRPGGILFVDVPNETGLYFRLGNLYQRLRGRSWVVNLAPTFSPYHVFGFSPRSLKALLHKHGLKPRIWRTYPGRSCLGLTGGMSGVIEKVAAAIVSGASRSPLGNYIEVWAEKVNSN